MTKCKGARIITPHAAFAWQYAFDNLTPDAELVFSSMGTGFDVTGVPLAQNSALVDAGLDLNLDPSITLYRGAVTTHSNF